MDEQPTTLPMTTADVTQGAPDAANCLHGSSLSTTNKQWKRVTEAIRDQEDVLIVEGFPQIDPETESVAVFAANITTKKLQMVQRHVSATGEMMSST